MFEEVVLRKDKMSEWVKSEAKKTLHEDCFTSIANSSARKPLEVGCLECQNKYREIATKKPVKLEPKAKKRGTKKFLYQRNIELERKNALLEKENRDLKVLVENLKKGGYHD